MAQWSDKSKRRLDTCHPDLQVLANTVLEIHDCSVFEGFRDEETQNRYFANGTSKVQFPNGKHNVMPSNAIDLAPYKPGHDPYDMENVLYFAGIVMATAARLYAEGKMQHKLRWGGTWSSKADATFAFDRNGFFDGIHFELEI